VEHEQQRKLKKSDGNDPAEEIKGQVGKARKGETHAGEDADVAERVKTGQRKLTEKQMGVMERLDQSQYDVHEDILNVPRPSRFDFWMADWEFIGLVGS